MKLLTAVTIVTLLPALALAQESPSAISADQLAEVAGGEILVDTERGDLNRGEVIGWIEAPLAELVAIVRDTENHDQWFPDTMESSASATGPTGAQVTGRTHLPIVRDRYWRLNGAQSSSDFGGVTCEVMTYAYDHTYEDGNMDELHGYWLLCPHAGGTAVKYVINADLGVWLPQPIVNWAQRRLLPGIITELAARHDTLH